MSLKGFRGNVMADIRKTPQRPVRRSSECHRLEDQLWSLAYQVLWPVIRKKTKATHATKKQPSHERIRTTLPHARRA